MIQCVYFLGASHYRSVDVGMFLQLRLLVSLFSSLRSNLSVARSTGISM